MFVEGLACDAEAAGATISEGVAAGFGGTAGGAELGTATETAIGLRNGSFGDPGT